MPGRRRYDIGEIDHRRTSEFVHDLLVRELNAELVPDSDKTKAQEWAQPKEKEEQDMGLFDQYAAEGLDLGDIELDSFAFKDGTYQMAFAGAELLDPSQQDWDPQIEFDFVFVANADGSETKYKGRRYSERLRYPATIKHDDDDKTKAAHAAVNRIAQRMHSLGVEDPTKADIGDINKMKGEKFICRLNTPTPKEGQQKRQFFNILSKKKTDEENTKNFFDQQ